MEIFRQNLFFPLKKPLGEMSFGYTNKISKRNTLIYVCIFIIYHVAITEPAIGRHETVRVLKRQLNWIVRIVDVQQNERAATDYSANLFTSVRNEKPTKEKCVCVCVFLLTVVSRSVEYSPCLVSANSICDGSALSAAK